MTTQIIVPALGESIVAATVSKWFKRIGEAVSRDEPLVELETEKVTVEVPAPAAGTLQSIDVAEGAEVEVGSTLGAIADGGAAASAVNGDTPPMAKAAPPPQPAPEPAPAPKPALAPETTAPEPDAPAPGLPLAPAVRKLLDEHGLDRSTIPASGRGGRLTKADVLNFIEARRARPASRPGPAAPAQPTPLPPRTPDPRGEEVVRMSKLRQTIARRLKQAQQTAAMLSTFNEVDMSAVMKLRADYRDTFEKKHGVRLGFMSFFVKAAINALKEVPAVNAEIHGEDLVYKNYYDIGVAVGGPQGLVVPVLRDADAMSFAAIERTIADLGKRAREGKLTLQELSGGTFTITNGGVFGSLLSTPILNPPQSGILGMHKIQNRPMAVGDAVEARPMMYLALSYDHRVIDGREAVTFLVRIKDAIEDPQRLLIEA